MRVRVFISESRISKAKFVEELKPKQRLQYLEKYPKSSFKKFTDNRGKIVEGGKPKAKPKLSGKPKSPKNVTPAKKTGRLNVTKKLQREIISGVRARDRKSVQAGFDAVNEGRATARTIQALKRRIPEDSHDAIDKAFEKSRSTAKANVESRRVEIAEKPAKKKSVTKRADKKTPAKAKPAKAKPAKAKPAKAKPVEQPKAEKPATGDAAKVVQKIPKAQRGSFMESIKRVFGREATEKDIQKIERSKKGMDKVSRETLDKLKRYAEEGIISKKEKESPSKPKPKSRKKLTKRQLYDRIREKDLPKITSYREREVSLKAEFKDKATEIAKGKGTKEQRRKKYDKLRASYVSKLKRNADSANSLIRKTRENMQKIKGEDDREDGF